MHRQCVIHQPATAATHICWTAHERTTPAVGRDKARPQRALLKWPQMAAQISGLSCIHVLWQSRHGLTPSWDRSYVIQPAARALFNGTTLVASVRHEAREGLDVQETSLGSEPLLLPTLPDSPPAPVLTKMITMCRSWEALEALYWKHHKALDFIHLCALLLRLVKHAPPVRSPAVAPPSPSSNQKTSEHMNHGTKPQTARSGNSSKEASAGSTAAAVTPSTVSAPAALLVPLDAEPGLRVVPKPHLAADAYRGITAASHPRASLLEPDATDCSQWSALVATVLARVLLVKDKLRGREVANVLWAVSGGGRAGVCAGVEELLHLHALAAQRLENCKPQELANIGLGLARGAGVVRPAPQLLQQLEATSLRQLHDFSAQAQANLFWAFAMLRHRLSAAWLAAFFGPGTQLLFRSTPAGLSTILYSLALMRLQPPRTWKYAFLHAVWLILADFDARSLVTLLWSLKRLGLIPPAPWMAAAARSLYRLGPALSSRDAAQALYALALLQWRPPALLVNSLLGAVAAGGSSAQALSVTAWSLAALRIRPSRMWLSTFLSDTCAAFPHASPQSLSTSCWALTEWGCRPSHNWVSQLVSTCVVGMASFSKHDILWLTEALARWQYHIPEYPQLWSAIDHRLDKDFSKKSGYSAESEGDAAESEGIEALSSRTMKPSDVEILDKYVVWLKEDMSLMSK